MNFKTTLVLLVLLIVVGLIVVFLPKQQDAPRQDAGTEGPRLFDFEAASVARLVIQDAAGQKLVLERSGDGWRMLEPVSAVADKWQADSLARELVGLRSRGSIDLQGQNAAATGLDKPRFLVEIHTPDKVAKLRVGDRAAIGDSLYIQLDGDAKGTIVAADVWEPLDRPFARYRQTRLVNVNSADIQQVTITRPDQTLILHRAGSEWKIVQPAEMPADAREVSEVLSAISFLTASEYVAENKVPPLLDPRKNPLATVAFSTQPPATQPTTQPAGTTIKVGGFDTAMKKNVYVAVSDPAALAKVTAMSVEAFNRKPLDLRERKVLDLDPATVSRITLVTDRPATTQPTTQPASHQELRIERRQQTTAVPATPATQPAADPAASTAVHPILLADVPADAPAQDTPPATQPATQPTDAQPATQPVDDQPAIPAGPSSTWILVSDPAGDASDFNVNDLLRKLHPLRAEKFLETLPDDLKPRATYTLKVTTQSAGGAAVAHHELVFIDPGDNQPLIGQYDGLIFQVARPLVDSLTADFTAGAAPPPFQLPDEDALPFR